MGGGRGGDCQRDRPPGWPGGKTSTSREPDLGSLPTFTVGLFHGVSILRLSEIESLTGSFYLSVAVCAIV